MRAIYRCRVCGKYVETPRYSGRDAEPLIDGNDRVALSKLVSYILRHNPSSINVKMDREGWVSIDDLVRGIREAWIRRDRYGWVRRDHILAIASLDPRGRFEVRGDAVRARYGHSVGLGIRVRYDEDLEVSTLYHGTPIVNVQRILREGLKPMRRIYVHLSTDVETACDVGRRFRTAAAYLLIDADCLRKSGVKVFKASKKVRVVTHVPPTCIKGFEMCNKYI